jgi:hypothetical protein
VKRRPLYVEQDEVQSNIMPASAETRNVVLHEDRAETPQDAAPAPLRSSG